MQIIQLHNLKKKSISSLLNLANSLSISTTNYMRPQDLLFNILKKNSELGNTLTARGVAEIMPDGFGFLRFPESDYLPSRDDIYIPPALVRRYVLRKGDTVEGEIIPPKEGENYFTLDKVSEINYESCDNGKQKIHFDNLTPQFPTEKLCMEIDDPEHNNVTRVIDLVAPLGKGQRGLIVAPPRTGKTVLLHNIAHAIEKNHPECYLIVLLIDERPEEVTDMKRSIQGEVIVSTFDEMAVRHIQVAEMVIEKAKRLVECGRDVVILLDSITRLARAYNTVVPSSGKVLTGGVDSNALQRPKKFFGAARNTEQAGSLSIIATALVETGSKMDEVIFEEFKGTGNSEIVLDRKIADRRIFPAVDILKSGTRREEMLVERNILTKMHLLRRILSGMGVVDAAEFLLNKMKITKNNSDLLEKMNSI